MTLDEFFEHCRFLDLEITPGGPIRQKETGCCPILAIANKLDPSRELFSITNSYASSISAIKPFEFDRVTRNAIICAVDGLPPLYEENIEEKAIEYRQIIISNMERLD